MSTRLKQPLNPAAVKAANEALWKANPELQGRQLNMSPQDDPYRQEWVKAYITAGGKVEKPELPSKPDSVIINCPPDSFDCGKAWKELDAEAEAILNKSKDPVQRNKYINAAYAKLYKENKQLHWLGAAAFASKQVGCGLQEAQKAVGSNIPGKSNLAVVVYLTLANGNRNVFKDVYPAHLFYKKYGIEKLRKCAGERQPPLDKKVLEGFNDTEAGRSADGAIKILQHEQQDILQTRDVFGNNEIKKIMGWNQSMSNYKIGKALGAKKTSVSYNPDCEGEPAVTFEGENPADPKERWTYAQKVVSKFEDLIKNPESRAKLEEDLNTIIERGK